MKREKKFDLLTILVIGIGVVILFATGYLSELDYLIQDRLYQKERNLSTDIVIVAIDDESLDVLGRWPWNREYHGMLLENIMSGSPLAVGVDVLMLEESADDEEFLSYIRNLPQRPIFASFGQLDETAGRGVIKAQKYNKPFESLLSLVDIAHINTIPDEDGIVRRTVLNIETEEGENIKSFASKIFEKAYGLEAGIPVDLWQRAFIRYAGKSGTFEQVPYHMVLSGEVDSEYFRDKVVLVGVTAIGLADDYYFPSIDRTYPMYGIEVHANIIDQLKMGINWTQVSIPLQLVIMILVANLSLIILERVSFTKGVLILLLFSGIYVSAGIYLATLKNGYIISLIYPLVYLLAIFLKFNIGKYLKELKERKRVTTVFSKYMEPKLVNKLLSEGESALGLGGVKKYISILFVDIRGFTPMSENLSPEEVVNILNDYLNLCAKAIFENEGTLDKYIGDAAMALFGAPLDQADHALKAVKTALYMKAGSSPLSERLYEKFGKTVSFGIGINTGYAIVGNIGAEHRLDYTAIGDAVNTAARLESNAKPGQIVISQSTYELVKDDIEVIDIGELKVKGKAEAIKAYEVVSLKKS